MTKISRVLIGMALLCSACTKDQKETPNGFEFTVLEAGDGVLPKKEEIMVFDYTLKDSKDSVWNSTYTHGIPTAVQIADSAMLATEKGMIQMFRMLSKGDSVVTTMPIKKFFDDVAGGRPPFPVDTTLSISYIIKVRELMNREEFVEFQTSLINTLKNSQVGKDANLINKYLSDKNITAQKDSSGIMYVMHKNKGGAKPTSESCVEVSYKGSFMEDGRVFDQNPKMSFPLSRVIPGWQKAIPLMGIGDSATFYIPSGLAYGPEGQPGGIPPNAILIFDVTLLNFGSGFDERTGNCN